MQNKLEMCFYFVYGLKPFIIKKFFNDKSDRAKSGYNTENVISNCNNFSLIINVICDFALSWWPYRFANFGRFSAICIFQFIKLISIFYRIDDFILKKASIDNDRIYLSNPKWTKEFSSGNPLYCLRDNWRSIILKSSAFSIHIYI